MISTDSFYHYHFFFISGIATSTQNASLTIFPIFVAALVSDDPSYFKVEIFFFMISLLGVIVCFWMHYVDKTWMNGILDAGLKNDSNENTNSVQQTDYVQLQNT